MNAKRIGIAVGVVVVVALVLGFMHLSANGMLPALPHVPNPHGW